MGAMGALGLGSRGGLESADVAIRSNSKRRKVKVSSSGARKLQAGSFDGEGPEPISSKHYHDLALAKPHTRLTNLDHLKDKSSSSCNGLRDVNHGNLLQN